MRIDDKLSNEILHSTASYQFSYTQELHELFEEISGSHNPLHTDDDFAKERKFPEKIGYGFLTSAMLSAMVGEHIPKKFGLYGMCRSFSCDFRKPVYIGDTLNYRGEITKIHKSIRQIDIDVTVTNQNGIIVASAKMKAGVFE